MTNTGMLKGKKIVFTGALLKMPRHKAEAAVFRHGGTVTNHVTRQTDIIVIADAAMQGSKFWKAVEIAESGGKIQFMREAEFYKEIRA